MPTSMTDPSSSHKILDHLFTQPDGSADDQLRQRLHADAGLQGIAAAVQAATEAHAALVPADVDGVMHRLHTRLQLEGDLPAQGALPQRNQIRHASKEKIRRPWFGVVAGAIALLAIGYAGPAVWQTLKTGNGTAMARTYQTTAGQRANFELPDGTRVVLGPESQLRYRATPEGTRDVDLTGLAYFTVVHDPVKPFTVRTGSLKARVLGTAFVVRGYATDSVWQVAVTEGKVSVGSQHLSDSTMIPLLPGDLGRMTHTALTPAVTRNVMMADIVGWMHGELRFERIPLRDVVIELQRAYGLSIRIGSRALAEQRVTMMFSGGRAADILDAIALATDSRYVWQQDTAVFTAP